MATAAKGKKKRATLLGVPRTDRDRKFCERWLVHFDHKRAYKEAGFSMNRAGPAEAAKKLEQFTEYLRPFKEAKAREVAKVLVVEQEDVLKAMSRKAVFDPGDFVETSDTAKTQTVSDPETGELIEQPVVWEGKPIFASRLKPFESLTSEQRQTVEIVADSGGEVRYRLPSIREQHTHLISLGRQYGMFIEKLITERHLHRHNHAHMQLDGVPTAKLEDLTLELLPYVGAEFATQLGFTQQDIEEARRATDLVAANGKS
jgi:hypothetical protein